MFGLSLISSFLSAFMNNVGAVGLLLPTAVRMADRKAIDRGVFGLPLVFASIIGGSMTLIGSAPNIIVASYMLSTTGQSFKMFDFAFHGLAMMITALMIWLILTSMGLMKDKVFNTASQNSLEVNQQTDDAHVEFAPFNTSAKKITIIVVLITVLAVSTGFLHPALGFGIAGLVLILSKVLNLEEAYHTIDLKIVIFLGSMLGIGNILERTSSIGHLSDFLVQNIPPFNPLLLIILLIFISSALSNSINNSAAAVFMAPLAVAFADQTDLKIAAALMAIAAGANLTLLLPTHQAALMVQSKASFSPRTFLKIGMILTVMLSLVAGVVIKMVWQ